jgi:hypothetical protein
MIEVILTRSKFNYNVASSGDGGGIYIESYNNQMVIAGCEIDHNSAITGGGLNIVSNNLNFAILDYDSYNNFQIVQSEHPYESFCPKEENQPFVIINATIQIVNTTGFILIFNHLTKIGNQDIFNIYDNNINRNLIYQYEGTEFPGVELPSVSITGDSFYYEFTGPMDEASCSYVQTHYSADIYGIVMYVYPIYVNPEYKTMITNNYASNNGGGIYGYDYNLFFITINSIISNNNAKNGGGVYFVNSNIGLTFEQVQFQNNTAADGGGLYLFTR